MNITQDAVVGLNYTVSNSEGVEIDTTDGTDPLFFMYGHGQLIPGLEKSLEGMQAGDKKAVTVVADNAYGQRHEELVQAVPKNMFEGMDPQVGMQFRATTDQGEQSVIIIDVNDDHVIVDGNHPLAGMDLSFDVEVVSVRSATADELEHGHVHTEEGDCAH